MSQGSAQQVKKDASKASPIPTERYLGVVKWFNDAKGFGFITRDGGDDAFVHYNGIRGGGFRSLKDGQRVEFAVSHGPKGLQAVDVVAVETPTAPPAKSPYRAPG